MTFNSHKLLPALALLALGLTPAAQAQTPPVFRDSRQPLDTRIKDLISKLTLAVPHTGMAVLLDVGEWNDIHPLDKQTVGHRLALAAEKVAYGDTKLAATGPLLQSAKAAGNKVTLTFANPNSSLVAKGGGPLTGFAVAGADKKFVWAQARIEGDKVVVWSDQVAQPTAVRYAWADNPEGVNLYNKAGLPASTFQTDAL